MAERVIEKWVTVRGHRVPIYKKNTDITEEQRLALDNWARNNKTIKKASAGKAEVKLPFYSDFNLAQDIDRAKAIETFISNGKGVTSTIYRGVNNVSDEDYKKYTTIGNKVDQDGLSSWTTDERTGHLYSQVGGVNNSIVFIKQGDKQSRKLGNIVGTDDAEHEVIMSAKATQVVERVEKKQNGVTVVYLR